MIELIQNMDWVLRTTLWLWIFFMLMRFGVGAIVGFLWGVLVLMVPRIGIATGIVAALAIWGLLIARVVFTIWSLFILIGYML